MKQNETEKSPKVAQNYYCECCYYNTSKKCDYEKHLATDKHKNKANGSEMVVNDSKKSQKVAKNIFVVVKKNIVVNKAYIFINKNA